MKKVLLQCTKSDRVIFHFNKHYLVDPTIPMWTLKHQGSTYYVDHLDSDVGFRTKETPDNEATKGSLQFKGYLSILEDTDGKRTAFISSRLTEEGEIGVRPA